MKKITKMYDLVRTYLVMDAKYRDSDEALLARVWYDLVKDLGFNFKEMSALALLEIIRDRKVPPADLITRARRKVQQNEPDLRGQFYINRKTKLQKEIIQELQNL